MAAVLSVPQTQRDVRTWARCPVTASGELAYSQERGGKRGTGKVAEDGDRGRYRNSCRVMGPGGDSLPGHLRAPAVRQRLLCPGAERLLLGQ